MVGKIIELIIFLLSQVAAPAPVEPAPGDGEALGLRTGYEYQKVGGDG